MRGRRTSRARRRSGISLHPAAGPIPVPPQGSCNFAVVASAVEASAHGHRSFFGERAVISPRFRNILDQGPSAASLRALQRMPRESAGPRQPATIPVLAGPARNDELAGNQRTRDCVSRAVRSCALPVHRSFYINQDFDSAPGGEAICIRSCSACVHQGFPFAVFVDTSRTAERKWIWRVKG